MAHTYLGFAANPKQSLFLQAIVLRFFLSLLANAASVSTTLSSPGGHADIEQSLAQPTTQRDLGSGNGIVASFRQSSRKTRMAILGVALLLAIALRFAFGSLKMAHTDVR